MSGEARLAAGGAGELWDAQLEELARREGRSAARGRRHCRDRRFPALGCPPEEAIETHLEAGGTVERQDTQPWNAGSR